MPSQTLTPSSLQNDQFQSFRMQVAKCFEHLFCLTPVDNWFWYLTSNRGVIKTKRNFENIKEGKYKIYVKFTILVIFSVWLPILTDISVWRNRCHLSNKSILTDYIFLSVLSEFASTKH